MQLKGIPGAYKTIGQSSGLENELHSRKIGSCTNTASFVLKTFLESVFSLTHMLWGPRVFQQYESTVKPPNR